MIYPLVKEVELKQIHINKCNIRLPNIYFLFQNNLFLIHLKILFFNVNFNTNLKYHHYLYLFKLYYIINHINL